MKVCKAALQAFIFFYFRQSMFQLPIPILCQTKTPRRTSLCLLLDIMSYEVWSLVWRNDDWPSKLVQCLLFWFLNSFWAFASMSWISKALSRVNVCFHQDPFIASQGHQCQSDLPTMIKAFPPGNLPHSHMQSSCPLISWAQVATSSEHTGISAYSNCLLNLEGDSSNGHQHVLLQCTPQIPIGISTRLCPIQAIGHYPWIGRNQNIGNFTTVQFFYHSWENSMQFSPLIVFTFFHQSGDLPNRMSSIHCGTAIHEPNSSLLVSQGHCLGDSKIQQLLIPFRSWS